MAPETEGYEQIPGAQDGDEDTGLQILSPSPALVFRKHELYVFLLSLLVNLLAAGWLALTYADSDHFVVWKGSRPIYSPVEEAISYHDYVMPGLLDRSRYHGPPTDQLDEDWKDLYKDLVSVIPVAESTLLPAQTYHFPPPEDRAIFQINVFHVMHCLNTVRKSYYPERYPDVTKNRFSTTPLGDIDHVDHCLNAIRQSIMCSADITPLVWQTPPGTNESIVHFNTVHTCRNYTAIQEWAHERNVDHIRGVNPDPVAGIITPLY